MKKTIILSVVLAAVITSLSAGQAFINPLPVNMKTTDNGGSKSAIDAYKDGVGAIVVNNLMTTDNSAMNSLVYKYGEAAKAANVTVVDQVLYGTGTAADKVLAAGLTINGATCNDSNVATTGETWLNGVCQGGISTNGTSCNDNNAATTGETWLNGVCQGGITGTVASNGLIYDNCESGARTWANAGTYCASKGMRLPTTTEIGSGSIVPSCPGDWTWTSTPYNSGIYYVWTGSSVSYYNYYYSGLVRCVK